ncbi:MAG: FAD-binding protein [Dehalococcoidales bacterium]|jgi:succinate dehydrogenase/fumarate reductase flavoprotein subunit|nr:FAD-binding protein [Dehalococcoidales bacterium]
MREDTIAVTNANIPLTWVHTLVVGSGAAGLNAAVQLRINGMEDILIITEGLQMGTSINTGSDKQTYYKLGLCGDDADSPVAMAGIYYDGGGMHGDIALVETSQSVRAFMHLVNLGMPFPRDECGQFFGYQTDNDSRPRATSVGPYTSREMCRVLLRRVRELGIKISERENVVQLLTDGEDDRKRAVGAIVIKEDGSLAAYGAENIVFAAGGPGGLYKTSVYPAVHTGAIGLALMAGAKAQNLPESQYGLASTKFRWNVSGTYMQAIPRFLSTTANGRSEEREFMGDYLSSAGEMCSLIFLKGYEWPFDARRVIDGSSLIDILVYLETVIKGRRVFLDYRHNPVGFSLASLSKEAYEYLFKSNALLHTPIERLRRMNPEAIKLFQNHGIDITKDPLEIAVCAQHNNGGLVGNIWWESTNIKHLFPVGEVNGSHGIYRPGGSALNSGQVAGFRVAEYIANRYGDWTVVKSDVKNSVKNAVNYIGDWIEKCAGARRSWQENRREFQERMTLAGANIRSSAVISKAVSEAWAQWRHLEASGCAFSSPVEKVEALRNRHLCFAHAVYLESILFEVQSSVGSRGSSIALDEKGVPIHARLGGEWSMVPENTEFRECVLETVAVPEEKVQHEWVPRRPVPREKTWFETGWAYFRDGKIYD